MELTLDSGFRISIFQGQISEFANAPPEHGGKPRKLGFPIYFRVKPGMELDCSISRKRLPIIHVIECFIMIMNAYSLIELFQIPKADIFYLLAQSSLQTPD